MTSEEIALAHPEATAALRAQGATAERERIQAVEGQLIPGHEALINSLKFDGKSRPGDAAKAVNAAEKQTRSVQAKALASDAPNPLPLVPAAALEPVAKVAPTRVELDAQAKAYMAAHPGTNYVAAVKHIQLQGA